MTQEQVAQMKEGMVHGPLLLIFLVLAIVFIVYSTSKWKLHPFLSLLFAAYGVAFLSGMPFKYIGTIISSGFGNLMTSIGLVIVFGTIIGTVIEKSGAALRMADTVLNVVGEKRSALAMSIIGYITSIPVFCDSGFVILTPLNKALARRAGVPLATMAVALSTGLYATHTLVPPTPGPIAAAGNVGADLGLVILIGIVVSIPAALVGLWWAGRVGKTIEIEGEKENISYDELKKQYKSLPNAWLSFAPIVVPIILIALSSIVNFTKYTGFGSQFVVFLGTPVNALMVGVLLSFLLMPNLSEETITGWIGQGMKDSVNILLITGAGGALGSVLSNTPMADYIKSFATGGMTGAMAILLLFIISALLKTAQGSSTVALVTTSSMMAPMLPQLGIASPVQLALAVMAIGAGAMTVSHVNDSYFWVVSQFSGMKVTDAYKAQTMATLLEGLTTIAVTLILFFIIG
ncbi:MAG: GntP family permease [Thermoanaerobacteraceae bacterium]|nr:GntP family permease [Thermoanaerobacteraceae bacterium]